MVTLHKLLTKFNHQLFSYAKPCARPSLPREIKSE